MHNLPDPNRSSALLIGASKYVHFADLPAVTNDLAGFRRVLVDTQRGCMLPDRCLVAENPTSARDLYGVIRHQVSANDDTILVYFAGHGQLGPRNELHLCLTDTRPDDLHFSSLPYDLLREALADSPARNKVVILDCCFSGRAIADMADDTGSVLGQVAIAGTYILTATPGNKPAMAPEGALYTAFTEALLGILWSGIPDAPEQLNFAVIYPHLRSLLLNRGLPQPRQQGSDTVASLAIVRNVAYSAPIVLPEPLPEALRAGLGSPYPQIRLGAVNSLGEMLADRPSLALSARAELERVAKSDLPEVAEVARSRLSPTYSGVEFQSDSTTSHMPSTPITFPHPPSQDRRIRGKSEETNGLPRVPWWKLIAALWILIPFLSCGTFTWAGFLIAGITAHRRTWKVFSATYGAGFILYITLGIIFETTTPEYPSGTIPDWDVALYLVVSFTGIVHSCVVYPHWLRIYSQQRESRLGNLPTVGSR